MGVPTSKLFNPTGGATGAVNPSFEFGGEKPEQAGKPEPTPLPTLPTLPGATSVAAPQLTQQEIAALQMRLMKPSMMPTGYNGNFNFPWENT